MSNLDEQDMEIDQSLADHLNHTFSNRIAPATSPAKTVAHSSHSARVDLSGEQMPHRSNLVSSESAERQRLLEKVQHNVNDVIDSVRVSDMSDTAASATSVTTALPKSSKQSLQFIPRAVLRPKK
jgi:hypothetical protein